MNERESEKYKPTTKFFDGTDIHNSIVKMIDKLWHIFLKKLLVNMNTVS
jgi:hypothetical protein